MERVAVIGPGGAGKSTLARKLGEATGLPVVHLDREHWRPGWVEPPRDEWESRVRELAAGERWIIDGNYGGTMEARLARADTIVFLDFGRLLCLRGAISRRVRYRNRARPDMTAGCDERLTWEFVKWIWDYRRSRRPGILALLAAAGAQGKRVAILRDRIQAEQFVRLAASEKQVHREPGSRILILGAPGSGKTTVSRRLGAALTILPVELDAHLWDAQKWDPREEIWRQRLANAAAEADWIIDGEYLPALDELLRRATAVVHLAVPQRISLYRRFRRGDSIAQSIWTQGLRKRAMFWAWLLTYAWRDGPEVARRLASIANVGSVFRLTNDREIQAFVEGWATAGADAAAPKR